MVQVARAKRERRGTQSCSGGRPYFARGERGGSAARGRGGGGIYRGLGSEVVGTLSRGVGAQLGDRLTQDPRDLHLAQFHVLADLRLGEVGAEAQRKDALFARGEDGGQARERGSLLGALEAVLVRGDAVAQAGVIVVVGRVE